MRQPALARFVERETLPGSDVASDDALDAFIRNTAIMIAEKIADCVRGRPALAPTGG